VHIKNISIGEYRNLRNVNLGHSHSRSLRRVQPSEYVTDLRFQAITPVSFVDGKGNPLTGADNNQYVIHFENCLQV
jgi:hypothetical protein